MDPEQVCLNHPDRKATSFCRHCGKHYCQECLKEGAEFYYCTRPECLKALEAELHSPAATAEPVEPAEPSQTQPEGMCLMAIYPNAAEFNAVKAKLASAGVEAFAVERTSGLIEAPFTVPVWLRIKNTDWEKTSETLKSLKAAGQPEPVDAAFNYDEWEDAQEAQAKLASAGLESFLWDRVVPNGHRIQEIFTLLVRTSEVEKATKLLIVPETDLPQEGLVV